jgi:large subunit ribosomal protein L1
MKRGKRYSKCLGLYDRNRLYSVEEAIQILKKLHAECGPKFDQTVELAMKLGVGPQVCGPDGQGFCGFALRLG